MHFKCISFIATIFLYSAFAFSINAQSKIDSKPYPLQVKWQLIENDYNHSGRALCTFTLINKSKNNIPVKGWTLYFNSSRDMEASISSSGASVSHVNGDIYQIKPTSSFQDINPNDSVKIEYLSEGVLINYTAAPCGLYIVWDHEPSKGIKIEDYIIQPLVNTTTGLVTPEVVYERNTNISDLPASSLVKIFPTPLEYKETRENLLLHSPYVVWDETMSFKNESEYLYQQLRKLISPSNKDTTTAPCNIILKKKKMKAEAYELTISVDKIEISAADGAGMFYGMQSLLSLMPPDVSKKPSQELSLPCVRVKDEPRFGYRSLMIDAARNFKPKQEMLRILDLMAMYKMNVLHFHFVDDEGWRIEIPSLPELTQIGAFRGHTLDSKTMLPPSYASGPTPGNSLASGYYSRADFIEILRYAQKRHIAVVPEIESPGHSRAAIKAMDARYERLMKLGRKEEAEKYLLRDLNDSSKYRSAQQWTDNVMCVAMPSVYRFMEKVVDELTGMYKEAGASLTTIHVGGDEVPAGAWEGSPACKKMIGKKIDDHQTINDINDLWYYYLSNIHQMLSNKGIQLSGWEEVGMRKTLLDGKKVLIPNGQFAHKNMQLHVWLNMPGWGAEDLPYKLANLGYKVVLSPVSNNYFDLAYYKSPDEPGYYWGGFEDLDKPFYFMPYDNYRTSKEDAEGNPLDPSIFKGKERLTAYGKSNIVGIQGLLWSENLRSMDQVYYMLLPKLLALAERAWSPDPEWANTSDSIQFQNLYNQSWSAFVNTVAKRELPRLDYYDGGFNYRIPSVGAVQKDGAIKLNLQLPGLSIRYTTDGTEPTPVSKEATSTITEKGMIKIRVFNTKGRGGRTVTIENK